MKKTLLNLFLVLAASTQTHAAFFVENKNVMAEVQTYTKGNKKIVLIDMIHIGPKKFYTGVKETIAKLSAEKSIILQEGVTHCVEKGEIAVLPTENTNFSILEKLYSQRHIISLKDAVTQLDEARFIAVECSAPKVTDEPNVFDRFKRRFSLYGVVAGLGLMRSQGSLIVYPKENKRESGDIASSGFINPIMKALAGSVVECLLNIKTPTHCISFKAWSETESGKALVEEFILKTRNDILLAKAMYALGEKVSLIDAYKLELGKADYENIILPWGADHMPGGLTQSIEDAGFVKNKTLQGIHYATCKNVARNPVLKNVVFMDKEDIKSACL